MDRLEELLNIIIWMLPYIIERIKENFVFIGGVLIVFLICGSLVLLCRRNQ